MKKGVKMNKKTTKKKIYIVFSHTNTVLSKIIKYITSFLPLFYA